MRPYPESTSPCVAIPLIQQPLSGHTFIPQPLCGHTLNPTAHLLPYWYSLFPLGGFPPPWRVFPPSKGTQGDRKEALMGPNGAPRGPKGSVSVATPRPKYWLSKSVAELGALRALGMHCVC